MQTGQGDLSLQETKLINGLIALFIQEVLFDALFYVLYAIDSNESDESDEARQSDEARESDVGDEADEARQSDEACEYDEYDEADSDSTAETMDIPVEVYRAAAKRELLSSQGIIHDIELMYSVLFQHGSISDAKSQDPLYQSRVLQVTNAQTQSDYAKLAEQAFTAAAKRISELDGEVTSSVCEEMDRFGEEEPIGLTGLRKVLYNAIQNL